MKRVFMVLFMGIGAIVTIGFIAGLVVGGIQIAVSKHVPEKTILELNLENGILEYAPDDPLSEIMGDQSMTLLSLVGAIDSAAKDDRVSGLIVDLSRYAVGIAQTQEIRDAIIRFKSTGKITAAFADTFGEVAPGNSGYHLASACDKIYLQPSGDVGLTGFTFESMFIKNALDKIGVTPRMDHRYEFKNAMNMFTETHYTDAHRLAMQELMDSIFDQFTSAIADSRKLTQDAVRELFDRGPFLGKEAQDAGLIDAVMYRDQVYDSVKKQAGDGAECLYLQKYLSRIDPPYSEGQSVALVYGIGQVARGQNSYDPIRKNFTMGGDGVAAALRDAIEDDDIKAIVFRVDSPGGSYVASDTIWRETIRAREAGKPVIVSMGNVAGSGGYFVAMAADKIVAEPATIAGSIGVLGGKMYTMELWKKLGINWDEIHTSKSSTMYTGTQDYTPEQWLRFQAWLDRVYEDFTGKVAEGRKLPIERVKEIAKGRIYSGLDAKAIGLVDEIGGIVTAIDLAKSTLQLKPEDSIKLVTFPKPKPLYERLLRKGKDSSESVQSIASLSKSLAPITDNLDPLLHMLNSSSDASILEMEPFTIRH